MTMRPLLAQGSICLAGSWSSTPCTPGLSYPNETHLLGLIGWIFNVSVLEGKQMHGSSWGHHLPNEDVKKLYQESSVFPVLSNHEMKHYEDTECTQYILNGVWYSDRFCACDITSSTWVATMGVCGGPKDASAIKRTACDYLGVSCYHLLLQSHFPPLVWHHCLLLLWDN